MIDEKKLAEWRQHFEEDCDGTCGRTKEILDTLEVLWKENAALRARREKDKVYIETYLQPRMAKLRAVARTGEPLMAALKNIIVDPMYYMSLERNFENALAALKEES